MIIRGGRVSPRVSAASVCRYRKWRVWVRRLPHREQAARFYRELATRGVAVPVGMVMLPKEHLDLKTSDDATGLADRRMNQVRNSGLLLEQWEREKFPAAAQAISRSIEATLSTAQSLQDPNGKRYSFSNTVWR